MEGECFARCTQAAAAAADADERFLYPRLSYYLDASLFPRARRLRKEQFVSRRRISSSCGLLN